MRKFSKKSSDIPGIRKRSLKQLDTVLLADDLMNNNLRILCKDTIERDAATQLLVRSGIPESRLEVYFLMTGNYGIEYYGRTPNPGNTIKFTDIFKLYKYRNLRADTKAFESFYRIKRKENE